MESISLIAILIFRKGKLTLLIVLGQDIIPFIEQITMYTMDKPSQKHIWMSREVILFMYIQHLLLAYRKGEGINYSQS